MQPFPLSMQTPVQTPDSARPDDSLAWQIQSEEESHAPRERMWPAIGFWKHFIVAIVLLVLVGLVYSNSFKSSMVLDNKYIIDEYYRTLMRSDPTHDIRSWTQVGYFFSNDYWWPKGISGLYRPITSLTYWFDYAFLTGKVPKTNWDGKPIDNRGWLLDSKGRPINPQTGRSDGNEPYDASKLTWFEYCTAPGNLQNASYHTINLLLHWLTAVLVYFVSLALFKKLWPAFFVAALFATHPIATESVTNIIGRADIFAAVAVFGGLLLYIRSTKNWNAWATPWLIGLLLISAFGFFSKESAAALVLVMMVYDFAFRWRRDNPEMRGLLPLIGHGALYLLLIAVLAAPIAGAGWYRVKHDFAPNFPAIPRVIVGCAVAALAVGQYVALAKSSRAIRWTSLIGVGWALALVSLLVPLWIAPIVAAAVLVVELLRGTLTSATDRYRAVSLAALYLLAALIVIALPILPIIRGPENWFTHFNVYYSALLGVGTIAAVVVAMIFTRRTSRVWRAIAVTFGVLCSVALTYFTVWTGIALAVFVAFHELTAGSLLPRGNRDLRRNWRLVWHGFAGGYLAIIPPLAAMFLVRAWVFANATPPEEPFLDNPIRGIWQIQQLHLQSFEEQLRLKPLPGMSFIECKMTAVKIMGKLLYILAWPRTLSSDYSFAEIPNFSFHLSRAEDWKALGALVACVLIFVVVPIFSYKRSKPLFFFVLMFFVAALPTSNFIVTIGSVMAERFMYLPLTGFTGALVICVFWAARKVYKRYDLQQFSKPLVSTSAIAAAVLVPVTIVYGARAYLRNPVWESDLTLWRAAIKDSPLSFRCYQSLAFALFERDAAKNVDEMIAIDSAAVPILAPLPDHLNSSRLYLHLGMYLSLKGDLVASKNPAGAGQVNDDARQWYRKAVDTLETGVRVDRAFDEVNKAKQLLRGDNPNDINDAGLGPVYSTLAVSYMRLGDFDKALARTIYQRQLEPSDIDAYGRIASIQLQENRLDDAAVTLVQCVLLDSNRPEVWQSLAAIYNSASNGAGAGAITLDGGKPRLNLSNSLVRDHVCSAYRDFVRVFRRAHRWEEAKKAAENAVERYDFPKSLFEPLLHEPVNVVTPDGVQPETTPSPE